MSSLRETNNVYTYVYALGLSMVILKIAAIMACLIC